MKTIVTLMINPAVDKSASFSQVTGDRKLRCSQPSFEPGGGINVLRGIKNQAASTRLMISPEGPRVTCSKVCLLKRDFITAACMTSGSELCRREDTERLFQEMRQGAVP